MYVIYAEEARKNLGSMEYKMKLIFNEIEKALAFSQTQLVVNVTEKEDAQKIILNLDALGYKIKDINGNIIKINPENPELVLEKNKDEKQMLEVYSFVIDWS